MRQNSSREVPRSAISMYGGCQMIESSTLDSVQVRYPDSREHSGVADPSGPFFHYAGRFFSHFDSFFSTLSVLLLCNSERTLFLPLLLETCMVCHQRPNKGLVIVQYLLSIILTCTHKGLMLCGTTSVAGISATIVQPLQQVLQPV